MIRAQMMEKLVSCQFLDNAKKQHHLKNLTCIVNSAVETKGVAILSVAIQECGPKIFHHIAPQTLF